MMNVILEINGDGNGWTNHSMIGGDAIRKLKAPGMAHCVNGKH